MDDPRGVLQVPNEESMVDPTGMVTGNNAFDSSQIAWGCGEVHSNRPSRRQYQGQKRLFQRKSGHFAKHAPDDCIANV
jgi:hypothetical protein